MVRATVPSPSCSTFLANVLNELLHFSNFIFISHTLTKVFSKMKLICYSATSLTLAYLLMLAMFPYELLIVTDRKAVKAKPVADWSTVNLL